MNRLTTIRPPVPALLLLALTLAGPAGAQQGPPPEVRAAVSRVMSLFGSRGEDPLERFADDALAPAYRASFAPDALLTHLAAVREAGRGRTGDVAVRARPDGALELGLAGGARFLLTLDDEARIGRLEVLAEGDATGATAGPAEASGPLAEPVTWDGLAQRLREAEAAGFAGAVLARRDGDVVLREAFGTADRATDRPTTDSLAYGIGSTPIDFTVTVARILAARGQLGLDDRISLHLADAPWDRAGMTIRHILEGRSGLPDFHDTADDWDPDLAWIDRETAIRRILEQPLLFDPGTAEAHSHSAFVLLAAILERTSGQSYAELVRTEILEPLGMARTGFYGETLDLGLDDFAVGHGMSSVGLPNIPPNWGPTSWLVMGSGGMFSTLDDLDRYYRAIAAGTLPGLEPERLPPAVIGGSDRGFFMLRADTGGGDSLLLLSNVEGPGSPTEELTRPLIDMVLGS